MPRDLAPEKAATARSRLLVAFAAVALAVALSFSNGHFDPFALGVVTLAASAIIAAALEGRHGTLDGFEPGPAVARAPAALLWLGLAASIAIHCFLPPAVHANPAGLGPFRPLLAPASLLALSYLWRRPPPLLARARFPLFLALAATMAAVVIRASPRPAIDVWHFQQLGSEVLARGHNPYAFPYPNIYGGGTPNYSVGVLTADGTAVVSNPYPPLTLLLDIPSVILLGEVRWVMLGCVLLAAWAVRRLGRGALEAELGAVLLLMQPRGFYVIGQSWTEPVVLASLTLSLLAAASWRARECAATTGGEPRRGAGWIATGLAGALLAASKQYSPLLLAPLFFGLPERGRWKVAALALGGAAAIALPFALWDPHAFFRGVVAFQVLQPFRQDALAWPAAMARLGGPRLPVWPALALAAAILAASLQRRVSLAQATTAAAAGFMGLLLLNKQAFCNYYWLAVGLHLAAVALQAAPISCSAASSVPGGALERWGGMVGEERG